MKAYSGGSLESITKIISAFAPQAANIDGSDLIKYGMVGMGCRPKNEGYSREGGSSRVAIRKAPQGSASKSYCAGSSVHQGNGQMGGGPLSSMIASFIPF